MDVNTIEAIIHELKTPLTGLSWVFASLSDLKPGDTVSNEIAAFLEEGKKKVNNALKLTDDALLVLNTSPDYTTYKFERRDLNIVIKRVIEENSLGAREKSINVEFNKNAEIEPFLFDEVKLTLAIRNVVNNAIKYTPIKGRVMVETKTEDGNVIISVSDTGVGIPAGDINKVFNKFFRSKNVEDTAGSGLGLYIVKNIVTGHGGRIEIKSNEEGGTKVTIFLPLKSH